MLSAIIRWSLRFPVVVCALAAILVVYGILVLTHAKYDVFPEFVPPQASVQTAPTAFVRREVRDFRPVLSGWFVAKGFAPGDRVVATGAAALLGIESPAPADAGTD